MSRERDVRNAIRDALVATGAFGEVVLRALPELQGTPASDLTLASIQPASSRVVSGWDAAPGGILRYACTVTVTVLSRNADPELCDDAAEQLVNYVRDAVNGKVLVPGYVVNQKLYVSNVAWKDPVAPERRVVVTVAYEYLDQGWDSADTTP